MTADDEFPHLGVDQRDRAVSVIRGAGALIPHGGRLIGSLLGSIIPGQRFDRIESFLKIIRNKIEQLSEDQQRLIAVSPEHVDFFEEGAFRAARALNEKRIAHIAFIVAVGMTKGTAEAIAQKRLLSLLSDLDEQDIIVLNYKMRINRVDVDEYVKNHPDLLIKSWPPASVFSPREDREQSALRKAIDNKLIRYNLVQPEQERYAGSHRTIVPEHVTELGKLILRTVGLIDNETRK